MLLRLLKYLLPVVVLAAGALATRELIESRPKVETRIPEVEPPLVRAALLQPQRIQFKVEAQGTVVPRTESALVPEVSGRVIEVSPALAAGGFFEKDEMLLRIDSEDFELAVVRTRAEVAREVHRLELEVAQAEVARKEWDSLGRGGEPSPLVVRAPQLAEARAALESARAALRQAERDLERTVIRAPYAGRVREKSVDVGQFVSRGASVARIYAVDYAEVRLPVPDDELAFVDLPLDYREQSQPKTGPRVRLMADFAGRMHSWWGRIVRTEGEIDPNTRMVHAIAQVENPYGRTAAGRPPLAVGMFVEAEIYGRVARDVFLLPRAALRGVDRVLVIAEGRLRFRQVRVLRRQGEMIVIGSGLEAGEMVCLSPLDTVADGMRVRVDPQLVEAPEVG